MLLLQKQNRKTALATRTSTIHITAKTLEQLMKKLDQDVKLYQDIQKSVIRYMS
jgi:hypothetical protein